MKILLAMAMAGGAGTLCRYGITRLPWGNSFPYGTLTVNLAGAFLAGFFYSLMKSHFQETTPYYPVLFIGFFGAFTTFSTFMLDTAKYIEGGQFGLAFINMILQNVLGLLFVWGGVLAGRQMS